MRYQDLKDGEVLFEYFEGPDEQMRYRFIYSWVDQNAPIYSVDPGKAHIQVGSGRGVRGQVFFCDPKPLLARCKERGERVFEVRR